MRLGAVVSACDANPKYSDCIPAFVKAWNTLFPEIQIRIFFIAEALPPSLVPFTQFIERIDPIPGVHTALHAQLIRLFGSRHIDTQDAVLITDIDMLPMNRRYYEEGLAPHGPDTIVSFRKGGFPIRISDGRQVEMLAMCYVAATPQGWRAMMGPTPSAEAIQAVARAHPYAGTHAGQGWWTDQWILTDAFARVKGVSTVRKSDADLFFQRLDRIDPTPLFTQPFRPMLRQAIASGFYCDYHLHHPVREHQEFIQFVLEALTDASKGQGPPPRAFQ
jgi:hypothetical protein